MNLKRGSFDEDKPPIHGDGFEVLDACHRQTLATLAKLTGLAAQQGSAEPDAQARETAAEIVRFFSTTARQHHEDEELHVFPKLLASADPEVVQAVQTLQQDHHWLELDWAELKPMLEAIAAGRAWYDPEAMREGVEVFAALSHDHVELEESWIYPEAKARLRAGERREMGREMAARRQAQRQGRGPG